MDTKARYKIINWPKYNNSLKKRGSLTIWFNEKTVKLWLAKKSKKYGRPFKYSNEAMLCTHTIRNLFRLPLRATEGFILSLFKIMKIDLPCPDYTSICRRAKQVQLSCKWPKISSGPVDLVFDSTGLKVYGEGEWRVRTHGKSKRRKGEKSKNIDEKDGLGSGLS